MPFEGVVSVSGLGGKSLLKTRTHQPDASLGIFYQPGHLQELYKSG